MSVKIRLQRHGKKGKPFYWVVAADARSKRDAKLTTWLDEKSGKVDAKKDGLSKAQADAKAKAFKAEQEVNAKRLAAAAQAEADAIAAATPAVEEEVSEEAPAAEENN